MDKAIMVSRLWVDKLPSDLNIQHKKEYPNKSKQERIMITNIHVRKNYHGTETKI